MLRLDYDSGMKIVINAINLICNHLGVVLQREKCESKTVLKIVEKP
jgi:hypothetical protein